MNTTELRNYLLKTGKRDKFIQYFKDHFVESQNTLGAYIPGQFRIKAEDDRFFWIRGFNNMQERSQFLPAFYGGEVWKEFGPAANEMMLEWHNVYLVKPLTGNSNAFDKKQGIFVIYYTARDNRLEQLIDLFIKAYIPLYNTWSINNITLWVSEMEENDFPRLPVYQDENLLTVISNYNNELEYESTLKLFNSSDKQLAARIQELVKIKNGLILYPAGL